MRIRNRTVTALAAAVVLAHPAAASAQQTPAPTDPEIAHIAVTANQIDIDLARVATAKTSDAEVTRFVETMIRDHTSVIEQATALVKELGVTPRDNDVSRSLQQGAAAAKVKLEPLAGAAFDRAYIDHEIEYHQAVIDAVKGVLVPNAKNAQLKGLLEKVLPALEGHLRMAKDVRAKVMG